MDTFHHVEIDLPKLPFVQERRCHPKHAKGFFTPGVYPELAEGVVHTVPVFFGRMT
jgi:hypothetical protein